MKSPALPSSLRPAKASLPRLATLPRLLGLAGLMAELLAFGGCASVATDGPTALPRTTPLQAVLQNPANEAATAPRPAAPPAVAPAPAAPVAAPPVAAAPSEPRFDLIVNNAPARDVFLALAADGRYNMLTHPELAGSISVTLRRVTMREALEALRDVYGYDIKVDGRRITVYPPTMQSRVFVVNYLPTQRNGRSEVRVSSGSSTAQNSGGNSNNGGSSGNSNGSSSGSNGNGNSSTQMESTQLTTQSHSDLWGELGDAIKTMIGTAGGRSVILSPQAGMVAVRAMPDELRQVETMLGAARMAIERQVMLDVKIVTVELREGYQSGIDWSVLRGRGAVGNTSGYGGNPLLVNNNGLPTLTQAADLATDALALPGAGGGLFGLSLATNGFAAVLGFLETHGEVQTLSSPRLATLNNQKAVLKVGTDDFFVTGVSGGTVTTSTGTSAGQTTLPTLTLTPFFSGIALDVTPQIDAGNMITLHVHPSVSSVAERAKQIDLGSLGAYKLPLASSSTNETDTVVRIPDGQIVAIGGLMQMETTRQTSGLPGSAENALTATVLGNRNNAGKKKELVVLIKPSIIRSADDWAEHTQAAWAALDNREAPSRVIRLDGPPVPATSASKVGAATPASAAPAAAPAKAAATPGPLALSLEAEAPADATPAEPAKTSTGKTATRHRAAAKPPVKDSAAQVARAG
ncbi:MAG TPA: secretin N-terminal domain-containing protein [Ideonella sp.]|uniref:secretin N-terminal domain-containing protein n=1 Tax=Ideonella sp. TaxID=1929293 RepID=UPI002B9DFB18|nr:secretin N-terminal domain-containing protein [Ideonella sp.]HSI50527.1 secretin N-terminal domain-containing protein [Ideonella sp.]